MEFVHTCTLNRLRESELAVECRKLYLTPPYSYKTDICTIYNQVTGEKDFGYMTDTLPDLYRSKKTHEKIPTLLRLVQPVKPSGE